MARCEPGPAALRVGRAVEELLPTSPVAVGASGGADPMTLALGAAWTVPRTRSEVGCVVIDHGLQADFVEVAGRTVDTLTSCGTVAEMRCVKVGRDGGIETTARQVCLITLSCNGHLVPLGHALDDQTETVLLGLLCGFSIRSLAGMSVRRGLLLWSLLGIRRAEIEAAYREWGVEWWDDPMNTDLRFARVHARSVLALLALELGRDVTVGPACAAELARGDADFPDRPAEFALVRAVRDDALDVVTLAGQPDALRGRVLLGWLRNHGSEATRIHVAATDDFVLVWRGQGLVTASGGSVRRIAGRLEWVTG